MLNSDIGDYEFDDFVNETLFEVFPDVKYDKIMEILNIIHNINHVPRLNIELDLNALESELENIIVENEDDSNDALSDLLYSKVISTFIDYLEDLGVIVTADIKLSELENIFRSLITIYTLDQDGMEEVLGIINNKDREDVEIFIDIIDDYTDMSNSQLLNVIEDIAEDLLSNLEEYYHLQLDLNNSELTSEDKETIEYLIKSNPMFINTQVVKDILNGKSYSELTDIKSSLYKTLEELENNTNLIPYEIVAALHVTNTEKQDLNQLYKEEIDLELVSWIGEVQDKHTLVDNLVASVITDLLYRR